MLKNYIVNFIIENVPLWVSNVKWPYQHFSLIGLYNFQLYLSGGISSDLEKNTVNSEEWELKWWKNVKCNIYRASLYFVHPVVFPYHSPHCFDNILLYFLLIWNISNYDIIKIFSLIHWIFTTVYDVEDLFKIN